MDVPGRPGLIDTGVSGSARVQVPSRDGLVEARISMDVSSRPRLIDARVAVWTHRTGVARNARLVDTAVACMQQGGSVPSNGASDQRGNPGS